MLAAGAAIPFARGGSGPSAASHLPVPVRGSGLEVIPRSAWARGLEPTGQLSAETVQFLLVHHTAGPNDYEADFVAGHLRDIFEFHTGPGKLWPDVCYNFFIDRFGRVWEGRAGSLSGPVVADATGGSQGFAQLVCLLGDFTSITPTSEAIVSLQRTLAWLADREGLDTSPGATTSFESRGSNLWPAGSSVTTATIAGHRDMSSTACPGDALYPYVHSELQTAVHALRGSPPPVVSVPLATLSPSTEVASLATGSPSAAPPSTAAVPMTDVVALPPSVEAPPTVVPPTATLARPIATGESVSPAKVGDDAGSSRRPVVVLAAIGGLAVAVGAAAAVRRSGAADDEGDSTTL